MKRNIGRLREKIDKPFSFGFLTPFGNSAPAYSEMAFRLRWDGVELLLVRTGASKLFD